MSSKETLSISKYKNSFQEDEEDEENEEDEPKTEFPSPLINGYKNKFESSSDSSYQSYVSELNLPSKPCDEDSPRLLSVLNSRAKSIPELDFTKRGFKILDSTFGIN